MNKSMIPSRERRAFHVEIRMDGMTDGEKPMMRGHAAVFDSLSETMRSDDDGIEFREIIKPGAFSEALKVSDCRALFNHNPDNILGRTTAGTLRMSEDANGLSIEIDPPDTMCARDLQISMARGDIREMSFGFSVPKGGDSWKRNESGGWIRTINKVDRLYDVSPVTYPAYPDTVCALRSLRERTRNTTQAKRGPKMKNTDIYRRKFDNFEGKKESRVNMGWSGEKTVGQCSMCSMDECLCPECENAMCCNMQAGADGACTKMMKPGCQCLGCTNTDQATLKQMYSM